jgi:hypothetical protein
MKINIRTTVHMPEVPDTLEIVSGTSLRDVLLKLFAGTPVAKEMTDPRTGDLTLEGVFEVSLNDVPHNRLPEGLGTVLRDGDALKLSLVLIGGG